MSMKNTENPEAPWSSVFIAAQPIFDLQSGVWGYEMLYRNAEGASRAVIDNPDQATANVIVDGLSVAVSEVPEGCKALINFTRDMLTAGLAKALPPNRCIIEILEDVELDDEVLEACRELKKLGYGLALDDYEGRELPEAFVKLVDVIKVDVPIVGASSLKKVTEPFGNGRIRFLAEKVEDESTDLAARMAGFSLFQGYYYARPKVITGRKIEPAAAARMRILQQAAGGQYDVDDISKVISSDVSLTHRLLKFMSAVTRSGGRKIKSIPEAVLILGSEMLKHWLMAVTLSDLSSSKNQSPIIQSSILRAYFLSKISDVKRTDIAGETLFLIGLLSQLDSILGTPMAEAIKAMPLDDEVSAVLLDNKAEECCSEAVELLGLISSLEDGDWRTSFALLEKHEIDRRSAARLFAEARIWSGDIVRGT